MIEHSFRALPDKHYRGWIGQFSFHKDGKDHTRYVRKADGEIELFGNKELAQLAAARSLCFCLDIEDTPSSSSKRLSVSRSGRSKIRLEAERVFGRSECSSIDRRKR
jgi:hypothetical protein